MKEVPRRGGQKDRFGDSEVHSRDCSTSHCKSRKTAWRRWHRHRTWEMKIEKEWVAGEGRAFWCDGPHGV